MKKIFVAALIAVLTLAGIGCNAKDQVRQDPPSQQPKPSEPQIPSEPQKDTAVKEFRPHLGGIKLGDSKEKVIQSFGTDYKQTVFNDDFSLGEPFEKLLYSNGVTVVIGSRSNSVLEIETNSPSISNNLDIKLGDEAREVFDKYRVKYKEPDSNQGEGKMIGWFLINDKQELVIFNFEKGESLGNVNVKPDSKVARIKLTNFKYMD